jgi:hypothetical protein
MIKTSQRLQSISNIFFEQLLEKVQDVSINSFAHDWEKNKTACWVRCQTRLKSIILPSKSSSAATKKLAHAVVPG